MAPSRPILALREAARLINVWADHNHADTTPRALAHWATLTASFTPHLPRPQAGLDTLLLLELAEVTADGSLRADASIRSPTEMMTTPDRLPSALRRVVLERLLHVADCAAPLREAFGYAKMESGGLRVSWRLIPTEEQASPAWIWLQELDLAEHEGEALTLDELLRPFVLDAVVRKVAISQAELEERLAAQRARAWLAEDLIVGFERKRLTAAGAIEYAELVRRVSIENAIAGYDVESYELTGAVRHIEVKCSAGPRDRFYLSHNEREAAERLGVAYWIAWVGWASRLPEGKCDVAWFHNPASIWRQEGSPWRVSYDDAIVQLVGNDSAHMTKP